MPNLTRASSQPHWNAADYAAHSASQQAWGRELLARLHLHGDEHVLDVGCGDGKVTAEIAKAVPRGSVTGIDSSPEMVRFARRTFPVTRAPNLTFEVKDARQMDFENRFDVVFSNAALHWVDDHSAFLRGAAAAIRPGGRLAVSCGGKGNAQEVFAALRSVLRRQAWRQYFRSLTKPYFFHGTEEYERWLPRMGFKARKVRLADRPVSFPDRESFAGWFRTTWLPYTQRVPEDLRGRFIEDVVDRYLARHPADASGRVVVRMVRLEIDAVKV